MEVSTKIEFLVAEGKKGLGFTAILGLVSSLRELDLYYGKWNKSKFLA